MWRAFRFYPALLPSRLFQRFVVVAAITIFCSMTLLAYAVSNTLRSSSMLTAAEEGALLIDFFVGPFVQELATARTLTPESSKRLDDLLNNKLGDRTKVLKVWLRDGTLVYSTNKDAIGENFPSRQIDDAFLGIATGSFDELDDPDDHLERQLPRPLIEIYAPLYLTGTKDVIAVGEIFNSGERLDAELNWIRIVTVACVSAVTAPMMLVLFFMVRSAGNTVDSHQKILKRKIFEARALAVQNDKLRQEADDARMETIRSNEHLLGQIGQDLHDGPIQLLSILALKLDQPSDPIRAPDVSKCKPATTSTSGLLAGALVELRSISTGLVLPQLDGLAMQDALQLAVRQHESITETKVACTIGDLPFCPPPLRVCLYRLVQEALNNAYYHASGHGQAVTAFADTHWIHIAISDSGSGSLEARPPRREMGLGLLGLRRRVEAFHGSFNVCSRPDGTRVSAKIPITAVSN
jgi:signal transduction histidine kinase